MFNSSRSTGVLNNMNAAQMIQVFNLVRPQEFDDDASVTSFVTLQSSTSNYLNYFYNKPFANGQSKKVKVSKSRGIRKILTPTKNKSKKNYKDNNSKKSKKVKNGFTIHASSSFKNLSSLEKPSDDHTVSTFTNTTLGTDSCLNTSRIEHATESHLLPKITEVVTPQHVHKPTHADIDSDFSNGSNGTRVSVGSTYSVADLTKVNLFQRTEERVVLGMTKHFVYNMTIVAVVLMFVWQLSADSEEGRTAATVSNDEQAVDDSPLSYQSIMLNLATALLLTRATVFSFVPQPAVGPVNVASVIPHSALEVESSLQQEIQQVIAISTSDITLESENQLVTSALVASTEARGNQLYVRSLCDLQMQAEETAYEYVNDRQVLPFRLQSLGNAPGLLNRFSDLKFHSFGIRFPLMHFRLPPQIGQAQGFLFFIREKLLVSRLCALDSCPSESDTETESDSSLVENFSTLKVVGDRARDIHNVIKDTLQLEPVSDAQSYDY